MYTIIDFLKVYENGSRQVTWLVAPKSMIQVGLGLKYQPCWFMVSKHHLVASLFLCIAQAWDMYMAALLFHVCNLWFQICHLLWFRNGFLLSSLPPIRVPYLSKHPSMVWPFSHNVCTSCFPDWLFFRCRFYQQQVGASERWLLFLNLFFLLW